jgi:hypothetical protein
MPDNATIYIADPSLLGSKSFGQIADIRSYAGLEEGGSATGVQFTLDAGQLSMNFMPEAQRAQHLEGLSGYARSVIADKDTLVYVLSRIHHVRLVLGCVITPGFDEAGQVQEFLFRFNAHFSGLLFFYDSVFDYDGQPLGGPLMEQHSGKV